ncbi:MAG: hypothetical protein ACOX2Q_05030 [Dehalobacterium sp.]
MAIHSNVSHWRYFNLFSYKKDYEPMLLLSIGFGAILVNIPP